MYGKRKPEVPPSVAKLQKELKELAEENSILKSVIALENFCPRIEMHDYRSGLDDLKRKFFNIMDKFKENAAKC